MRPMMNLVRGDLLRVDLLRVVRPLCVVFRDASTLSYTLLVDPLPPQQVSEAIRRSAPPLQRGLSDTEFGLQVFDQGTPTTRSRRWIWNRIRSISGLSTISPS